MKALTVTLKLTATDQGMIATVDRAGDAVEGLGGSSDQARTKIGGASSALRELAAEAAKYVSAAAVATFLTSSTRAAIDFDAKMREVSTLLSGDVRPQMVALTQAAKDQAQQFGAMPIDQSAALYQIISAGATSAAAATDTLTASNKLAVGGVTDVRTAADGLTTVMNAYGGEAGTAAEISDAMFIGMRAGKTTIGELSASFGVVAPLAAQAGVKFDELVSAAAALTKGGVSTSEAMTGLRGIVAAIIKPTKEASDMARALGIQFDAQALKSKGLAGFMEELRAKVGNNTQAMAKLFGGVEALNPALALTGKASKDFANTLQDMEQKAGATDRAFGLIAAGSSFQLQQVISKITVSTLTLGESIMVWLNPALTYANEHFDDLLDVAGELALGIGLLVVARTAAPWFAALGTAVAGFTTVTAAATSAVGVLRGALALLGGPIGAAIAAIGYVAVKSHEAYASAQKLKAEVAEGIGVFAAPKNLAQVDALRGALGKVEAEMAKLATTSGTSSEAYKRQQTSADLLRKQIAGLEGATQQGKVATTDATAANAANAKQAEIDAKVQALLGGETTKTAGAKRASASESRALAAEQRKLQADTERLAEQTAKAAAAHSLHADKVALTVKEMGGLSSIAPRLQSEMDRLNQAVFDGTISQENFATFANEATTAVVNQASRSKESGEKVASGAREAANEYGEAWKGAMERVDAAFANAWKGAFDSFSDFGRALKDAFAQLLAELAHMAITKPILVSLGLGGAGTAGAASGGIGGIAQSLGMNQVSGLLSGALGTGANYLGALLGGAGTQQASMLAAQTGSFGLSGASATTSALGGTGLAGLGIAGALGGLLGSTAGGYGTAGGSIGAIGGMLLGGPFGAALGGALGSAVGSLFGGKWGTKDAGVDLTVSGGEISGSEWEYQTKKKLWSTKRRTIESELDAEIQSALQWSLNEIKGGITETAAAWGINAQTAIEEFTASSGKISLKGLKPEEALEKLQGWVNDVGAQLMAAAMPQFSGIIQAAGDRAGELLAPLLAIGQYVSEDWAPTIQTTLMDAARSTGLAVIDMARTYDGSVESTKALADAVQQRYVIEQELLAQIDAVGKSVAELTGGVRERIERTLRSDEEQMSWLIGQADQLRAQLQIAGDPTEIHELVKQVTSNISEQIGMMSKEELAGAQARIDAFLGSVDAIGAQRLAQMEADVKSGHAAIADAVTQSMYAASSNLSQGGSNISAAAASMNNAAAALLRAAANLNGAANGVGLLAGDYSYRLGLNNA
jgi:TP901 family phage tail tape measure protein